MRWARQRAIWIAKNIPSADVYFRNITAGSRSLTALLADSNIWVNFHATLNDFGVTPGAAGFATECAIGPSAFRIGRWTVLATLIHELAHCNGAPGGASTAAEDALPHCGLGTLTEFRTGVDDPHSPYTPGLSG
ncbi:hypothetical protein IVG45_22340 [Methylomonas sp. LL1]|uniref:hypothetical protein n=1 Tax=Methylomonas sp. LL1 TaxID=2785785 RepID=UPI0018C3C789|nr:hypothetical protein [Methylomonas sp. LL1]QPK63497.1 hypothetical protein IVG45_22340 [Methylomonas sp. LL1]